MHANQIARIRQTVETAVRMGSIAGDVEAIVAHAIRVEEFNVANQSRLEWQRFPLTVSDDELVAAAAAKSKAAKKSAGARALVRKYGKQAADRIITEKTGKHISLQG
jgi:hypothetical protein